MPETQGATGSVSHTLMVSILTLGMARVLLVGTVIAQPRSASRSTVVRLLFVVWLVCILSVCYQTSLVVPQRDI